MNKFYISSAKSLWHIYELKRAEIDAVHFWIVEDLFDVQYASDLPSVLGERSERGRVHSVDRLGRIRQPSLATPSRDSSFQAVKEFLGDMEDQRLWIPYKNKESSSGVVTSYHRSWSIAFSTGYLHPLFDWLIDDLQSFDMDSQRSSPGVSKTRPTGRMRLAVLYYAAPDDILEYLKYH